MKKTSDKQNTVATLKQIWRFPIKGFAGESMTQVNLTRDQGIPLDRQWAIRNGSIPESVQQQWEPCQAFVRMTQHSELPTYQLTSDAQQYALEHPTGERLTLVEMDKQAEVLERWFQHASMSVSRANTTYGYWDHSDAHISIINLTTLIEIGRYIGKTIDPQRFRGNLLIETDQAWSELAWIGRRIRIGDSELEIIRPIDRCKATSIDLQNGQPDINMPHLLASRFGHIFCGLYARVVRSGRCKPNDAIQPLPQPIHLGIQPSTAPALSGWPRAMQVIQRKQESRQVVSLYLADPLGQWLTEAPAASYLRLHANVAGEPLFRAYTVTACGPYLRISIKNEGAKAAFSPWIHEQVKEGDTLLASGPFVDPSLHWKPETAPAPDLCILTAGIGITMACSIVARLKHSQYPGRVHLAHSVAYQQDAALWNEVLSDLESLPKARAQLFLTKESQPTSLPYARPGRVDLPSTLENLNRKQLQVFICGPGGFSSAMRDGLIEQGVATGQIHEDTFYSPSPSSSAPKAASRTEPANIQFEQLASFDRLTWHPEDGTLLELLEAQGFSVPAHCRSGACRACLHPIEGEVEYLSDPVTPAPKGWAYLCCAAPLGPVKIKKSCA